MQNLLRLLDRPIAFHPSFVELTGSVNAAIMLSQAFYWAQRTKDRKGWFYKTREQWTEETRLSRTEQENARKLLRKTGFWIEERRGLPSQLYFRIDLDKLESCWLASSRTDSAEPAVQLAGNLPTTKDQEITSETTHTESRARGGGYKQPPKPIEEKYLYPPPDFQVSEILYLWLAEMCFVFSDTELVDATNAWRESRASKPNHFARTLPMWQADWQKFIRAYWQIRQRDKARSNGNGNGKYHEQPYTGPVKSKPDPVKENCQRCRGMGTYLKKIDGIDYAFNCNHQGQGVAA